MAFNKKKSGNKATGKKHTSSIHSIPLVNFFNNLDDAIANSARCVEQDNGQYLENGRYSKKYLEIFLQMIFEYTVIMQTLGIHPSHSEPFMKALSNRFGPPNVLTTARLI